MIYTADQMITGDGVTVIPQGAVRVDSNGTILAAGTREELTRQFPEEKVLAFNGCSLLPGLIDMHVHFGYYYSQPDVADFDDFMIAL